jgi:putative ABC transport system permease protein
MSDWSEHLRPRLATLRLSPAREAEIVDELSQHLDERYEELRAAGSSEAEARRLAIAELLEPDSLARRMRTLRQARVSPPITPGAASGSFAVDVVRDVRYALRTLRKQPAFAAVAILTLALGIGANSAIFALVDGVLLRPLPFGQPDRLVMLSERSATSARDPVSPLNLLDWHQRNRTFDVIAGYTPDVGGMVMTGADGLAENISRQWVTAGFFDVLGVRPLVGRTFLPEDDTGRAKVVVLSEGLWRARFDGDPSVVGRDIRLDGMPFTVVGVVPKTFQLLGATEMWAVRPIHGAPPAARSAYVLQGIGRLKPGVTLDAASADLEVVAEGMAREFPATNRGRGVTIEPLHDALVGSDLRYTSMLFIAVVGFVLLICCANVANLLLARATVRTRELAIRSALGAVRSRLIRQLLTESVVLAALGGALGLAIGAAILEAAPSLIPAGLLPATVTLDFDLRVVAFCAAAALLVGLLFGMVPAWKATRFALPPALASDSRTATGHGGRIRSLLVAGEVAAAVLLLFGAGLLLRTLLALENVDRGYRADGVLSMMVDPLGSKYPTPESLLRFFDDVEREVKSVPGVEGTAWATTVPLGTSPPDPSFFEIAGEPPPDQSARPVADYHIVSPGYFRTLDLPIVTGRSFTTDDTGDKSPVCIVSRAFVDRYLPGRSPIGVRIALRPTESTEESPVIREIVGVARQVRSTLDASIDRVHIYVPLAQDPVDDIFLLVRSESGPPEALTSAVRAAIGRVDVQQLVSVRDVMTLSEVARDATARHRFRAVLVMTFAGLALLLAMVGVFGILAYSVQQSVREIGLRRALGATTRDILRLIVGHGVRVIAAGAVIGLAVSAGFSRVLSTMLYGVQPLDPLTFAFVAIALVVTAAVAMCGPVWQAIRVDPAVALRGE